jgi:hypothetical protein
LYNEAAPRVFVEVLNHSDTILAGKTVLFQAVISPSPEDVEFFWIIENKDSPNYPVFFSDLLFERNFTESGLYNIKFHAKDRFYDAYRDSLFIRVSNAPACNGLGIKIFQGSPTFKWNCIDMDDNGSLTYRFLLLNTYGYLHTDTTLTEDSLQLGYALQENDIIRLVATNKYGLETHLDTVWGSP